MVAHRMPRLIHEFGSYRIIDTEIDRAVGLQTNYPERFIVEEFDGLDGLGVKRWKLRKSTDPLLHSLLEQVAIILHLNKARMLDLPTEGDSQ